MHQSLRVILLVLSLVFAGCTKNWEAPVVSDIKVSTGPHGLLKPVQAHPLTRHTTLSNVEAKAEVTFKKEEIFGKQFLYGADLQHSSVFDEDSKLYDQVYALGHELVFFRQVGNELQLVVDQSQKFESDVNHPERLINSFPILASDEQSVTVAITQGSPVLRQMFWTANAADVVRNSWIRSIQFVPEGNYLLIESSVETLKGQIVEHMESIFPRETLLKNAPSPILMWDNEPLAKRFRFLGDFPIFRNLADGSRKAVAAASRFNVHPGEQIKWYVTDNAPEDILRDIKNSVEGWNRYFQDMWGQPGMTFEGHLPADVKLGDPRYNVIVWDNVYDGNAAYESQAVDPISGIQSHSNVYIPQSWLRFGTEYWEKGQLALSGKTEAFKQLIAKRKFMDRPLNINCVMGPEEMIPLAGKTSDELRDEGREVLKGVIFHEVGHGLGLGHNFKGSLSYESNGLSTSSIMDYNYYFLESKVFTDLNSSAGPLLEYDRQFLAAVYNQGQGLAAAPVMPACDDGEADNLDGGVDPLCTRYDAGSNPIQWMKDTRSLIDKDNTTLDRLVSLSAALRSVPAALGPAQGVATETDTSKKVDQFLALQLGTVNFYFVDGAQSLRYVTQAQIKDLKVFQEDILPAGFLASDIRTAVNESLNYSLSLSGLPETAKTVYTENKGQLLNWVHGTNYFQSLGQEEQKKLEDKLQKRLAAMDEKILGANKESTFAKMRLRLLGALTRTPKAPHEFSLAGGQDYEASSVELLKTAVINKMINDLPRSIDERLAAAKSLKTFSDTTSGEEALSSALTAIAAELKAAATAQEREDVRSLINALK